MIGPCNDDVPWDHVTAYISILHIQMYKESHPRDTQTDYHLTMTPTKHALVFGASGISGNSLCDKLLVYPTRDTFARVTGLTNRPLSVKDANLPNDPRLELVSGIDLTKSVEDVKRELKKKVKNVRNVTHVFYMGIINVHLLNLIMFFSLHPNFRLQVIERSQRQTP